MGDRRRLLMSQNISSKNRNNIVAGDILYANANGEKIVLDKSKGTTIYPDWTPIGIVVVPPSHDVYGTGEGAVIGLRFLSDTTPDTGGVTPVGIYSAGGSGSYLPNLNFFNITDNTYTYNVSAIECKGALLYSSEARKNDVRCITDSNSGYNGEYIDNGYHMIPSPYNNGNKNPYFSTLEYSDRNALSDFNGLYNTNVFIGYESYQSNWKTATTIKNIKNTRHFPKFLCAWRYHTIGTNQGDWYIPSIGEVLYFGARYSTIANTIINQYDGGTIKNINILNSNTSTWIYSSTTASVLYSTQFYCIDRFYATVSPQTMTGASVDIPFMRF